MGLSMGIVGLPNVGKSTLFNALTEKKVPAENYPFCTIDPSVGVVAVPDERLNALSRFSQSAKTVPAAIEFTDIAGLVKGASEGEGLGNQFLSHIREVDAIVQMVRIFDDAGIAHVEGSVDPLRDIEVINLELILADMQTVSKRIASTEKKAKRGEKEAAAELSVCRKIAETLEEGKRAEDTGLSEEERKIAAGLHLLSFKPVLYCLNKKAGGKNLDDEKDERFLRLKDFLEKSGEAYVTVDAGIEHELSGISGEERGMFRKELGAEEGSDGVDDLIRASHRLLGLATFFTTGPEETRAWTIRKGALAPEAGAAIHTDFRDKFIRADVIFWKDLLDAGSYAAAREKGLVRTEGKEYAVKDGDVIEFKI